MKLSNEMIIDANQYVVKAVQILAKKRSGKSYTASKIAEELLKEKIPIVIIDPISAHWGLKEKFEIIVFGDNEQADIGLYNDNKDHIITQAQTLGHYIATSKDSAIIDLNAWTESQQQLFGHHFFNQLYQDNSNRRHLFVEEADIFAAQLIQFENEALYCRHALDNLVRRGGAKGLGTTIITQRPALVSKNILSQSDLSIVLNLQASQDIKAFGDIIKDDDEFTKDDFAKIKNQIKKAERGLAYFYSPQWLLWRGFTKILKKETYHAGATLGDPDYRPPTTVHFSNPVMDIEDVKKKLASLQDKKAEVDEKQDPLLITVKKHNEIVGNMQIQIDADQKHIESLESKLKMYYKLKDTLQEFISIIDISPQHMIANPTDLTIDSDTAQATVRETLTKEEFDDQTNEGRLIILITEGFFDQAASIELIHGKIDKLWEIPDSEKPGKSNVTRYRRKLRNSLDLLSRKPYQYLKEDDGMWIRTDKAIKNIQVIKR